MFSRSRATYPIREIQLSLSITYVLLFRIVDLNWNSVVRFLFPSSLLWSTWTFIVLTWNVYSVRRVWSLAFAQSKDVCSLKTETEEREWTVSYFPGKKLGVPVSSALHGEFLPGRTRLSYTRGDSYLIFILIAVSELCNDVFN